MKQPNTLEEALEITYDKLGELTTKGIEVTLKPSRSRHIESTLQKYGNKEGRLKPAYWFNANLKAKDDAGKKIIFDAANELSSLGIGFDTGGCCGGCGRDWELDWSFRLCHINSNNMQGMREGRAVVEDLLNGDMPIEEFNSEGK